MIRATRRALLGAGSLLAAPTTLRAQQGFPSRPITVIVPNPPGGGTDFAARLFQEGLQAALGQPVVIENRPGANGNIAINAVVRAQPDGHTLLLQYNGYHAGNPAMMRDLTWDPIRDLSLVGMATMAPHVILVAPNVPANTLAEFIAHARANPGKLNYASSGNGSIQHIGGVLFARAIGAEMVHVPYRGAAPALQDVAGGRVEMFITTPSSAVALVQGGRVKALAMASARRAAGLPEVPTTAEAGLPGFTLDAWFAFAVPAATPRPVQDRLNAALRDVAMQSVVRQRAEQAGAVTEAMSLEQLDALSRKEVAELGAVIRSAGITLE
ncbi:Bug family tripartite tricarboxylate transporter substrate binding protein [Neoroseomonas oryzicola]|uniref:Tripartite tricarboxylate transporter substrate binding protein n=1 Tax=Neoroseomonas oryzicola TaxID=535904 RepID=A0A9X9WKU6_9PROT|nr:tripartite tricarboxylate transporter substrate binding protein [Neoroseomonas oryzicola]MBR0660956.1 tripartite tricarboxylate transporter substrate binding protein [Neoroseomonas oryzicola]NKE19836.1 tripartite tricarboxylate transporter substrate binding protein [Neoroseomonas oryzicola]